MRDEMSDTDLLDTVAHHVRVWRQAPDAIATLVARLTDRTRPCRGQHRWSLDEVVDALHQRGKHLPGIDMPGKTTLHRWLRRRAARAHLRNRR